MEYSKHPGKGVVALPSWVDTKKKHFFRPELVGVSVGNGMASLRSQTKLLHLNLW